MPNLFESKLSRNDHEFLNKIAERAIAQGINRPKMYLLMDLTAACRACPLRLEELLQADNANFFHDVLGIIQHLNRTTGELTDCFVPRYARR